MRGRKRLPSGPAGPERTREKTRSKKKSIRLIALLLALLCALGIGADAWLNPRWGAEKEISLSADPDAVLTGEQAREDAAFVMKKLRTRHPAWLEEGNERVAEVEARYAALAESLPEAMTVMELYNALGFLLAPLRDGHTYVYHASADVYVIDDFSYIETYGRPIRIDGEGSEDVLARYLSMQSYEIESVETESFFSSGILVEKELLRLGIDTSDGVDFTYLIDGEETTVHHAYVPYAPAEDAGAGGEAWVRYEIDRERDLGIFTLTTCVCDREYKDTLRSFFEAVDAAGIGNVCVDLRGNGGGNSAVASEFLRYLAVDRYAVWDDDVRVGPFLWKNRNAVRKNHRAEPRFSGNIYVLTDKWTYSSAMDFAMLITDNGLGTIVGEASGNLPDSYGDCVYFLLPNAKLNLSVSWKRWYRIDHAKAGEQILPDVACAPGEALRQVYELIGNA